MERTHAEKHLVVDFSRRPSVPAYAYYVRARRRSASEDASASSQVGRSEVSDRPAASENSSWTWELDDHEEQGTSSRVSLDGSAPRLIYEVRP